MKIQQFEDENLSHFSYAVMSECERKIILIDPSRNTQPYLKYAHEANAIITGIIETHPHADFVSSHLELHRLTGATIYASELVEAFYPHETFDEGQTIELGKLKLWALNTPGHSPDSICIVLKHEGKPTALFSGDTLFIGDCGRPDLREDAGKTHVSRRTLAKQMYHSLRDKLMKLPDDVILYPAHGAGTLCGKNLSPDKSSTLGKEKQTNWSLQPATEEEFIQNLLADQPFVPRYFTFDVELNRKGAENLQQNIDKIKTSSAAGLQQTLPRESWWVIDTRNEKKYKEGHLPHSINVMAEGKFETWLGSIISPGEKFYLALESEKELQPLLKRVAAIGYEEQVAETFVLKEATVVEEELNVEAFQSHTNDYTIVDVRNKPEVEKEKKFEHSLSIPLAELRTRIHEIPIHKPIVVHCAGSYRSAAGSSLIQSLLGHQVKVFDLGEAVKRIPAK